jgi:hypothetical protein
VPPDDEPRKILAVVKVVGASAVLVGVGVAVYMARKRSLDAAIAHQEH